MIYICKSFYYTPVKKYFKKDNLQAATVQRNVMEKTKERVKQPTVSWDRKKHLIIF